MNISEFDYELPKELIAQTPLKDRSSSRLLVLDKNSGDIVHEHFTNIIEYFAMIGYQENYIKKIMDNNKYKEQINYPTILFSATSNTDFGIIDLKLILTQVYPETPKLIFINKDNKNDEEEDRTFNTVYSFCYDSLDGKKKLFYDFVFKKN